MAVYYFRVNIPYLSFEQLYRVPTTMVKVQCKNGQSLQLPAQRFKPFLSQLGIRGRFELQLGENNQFITMLQIAS